MILSEFQLIIPDLIDSHRKKLLIDLRLPYTHTSLIKQSINIAVKSAVQLDIVLHELLVVTKQEIAGSYEKEADRFLTEHELTHEHTD